MGCMTSKCAKMGRSKLGDTEIEEPAVPGVIVAMGMMSWSIVEAVEGSGKGEGTNGSAANGVAAEGRRN